MRMSAVRFRTVAPGISSAYTALTLYPSLKMPLLKLTVKLQFKEDSGERPNKTKKSPIQ